MHLIATAGCPSLVLFSDAANPAVYAPGAVTYGYSMKQTCHTSPRKTVYNALSGFLPA